MSADPEYRDALIELADEVIELWNKAANGSKIFDAGQRRMATRVFNLISAKVVEAGGNPLTMEDL